MSKIEEVAWLLILVDIRRRKASQLQLDVSFIRFAHLMTNYNFEMTFIRIECLLLIIL